MNLAEVFIVALVLAMDAMAVSVTNGIKLRQLKISDATLMGVFFGAFQFIMPLLGFFLGESVASFVGVMAPYLSFGILAFLGVRMIIEAREEKCINGVCKIERLKISDLILQAIATSIDALAVGLSFSMAQGENHVFLSSGIIGIVAFICSVIGALAGKHLGKLLEKWAETIGGIILIVLGLKMLIENFL